MRVPGEARVRLVTLSSNAATSSQEQSCGTLPHKWTASLKGLLKLVETGSWQMHRGLTPLEP